MDWTCILVLSLSPLKYTPKWGFGISGVTDNTVNFIPSYQRIVPTLKPYPPEANVPGNAGGWVWRDGSMTFCRKGNQWDKVACWSTIWIRALLVLHWSNVWKCSIWLVLKTAASKEQCCILGNVLTILLPLPPCLADEERVEQGINHIAIIGTGLNKGCENFELPNSEFPIWEGNVSQIQIFQGLTSLWQILFLGLSC